LLQSPDKDAHLANIFSERELFFSVFTVWMRMMMLLLLLLLLLLIMMLPLLHCFFMKFSKRNLWHTLMDDECREKKDDDDDSYERFVLTSPLKTQRKLAALMAICFVLLFFHYCTLYDVYLTSFCGK